eukprot:m.552146 g.552146  ORF g.552146 m.552146 type:complete len:182 (+) comp22165_c0_seq84:2069-2614(+)
MCLPPVQRSSTGLPHVFTKVPRCVHHVLYVCFGSNWVKPCRQRLCDDALGVKGLRDDSRFKTPDLRVRHRAELDQILAEIMAQHPRSVVMQRLRAANIACARVCDVADLVDHPQLQTTQCMLPVGQLARVVSPPVAVVNDSQPPGPTGVPATSSGDLLGAVPRLGEHTAAVWAEFGNEATC